MLVAGRAAGEVLLLAEPLSFWGGIDVNTGRIIDRHHPQAGLSITGKVLVMPAGRGSSSSSSVLAESLRIGSGPAAILLREADVIVALGAMVAQGLYGVICPVALASDSEYAALRSGFRVLVRTEEGTLRIEEGH